MKWQAWSVLPIAVLLFLVCLILFLQQPGVMSERDAWPVIRVLRSLTLVAWLPVLGCGAVVLWHTFRTARRAFGVWAGLGYVLLAILLAVFLPLPAAGIAVGILVVPHMVRLDIKLLIDEELNINEGPRDESRPGAILPAINPTAILPAVDPARRPARDDRIQQGPTP
jgi:hypothetical protein